MGNRARHAGQLWNIRDDAERDVLEATSVDPVTLGVELCANCLAAGGFCTGCVQSIGPRIAMNIGWLRLMAAAAYRANPLAETPPVSAAGAAARRREDRKAKKAQVARIARLVSGQLAHACTTRAVFARVENVYA